MLHFWEVDDHIYNAQAVKEELLAAVKGDVSDEFRRMVRQRMVVGMLNQKMGKAVEVPEEEGYGGAQVMSSEAFARLMEPKEKPQEKNEGEKIRLSSRTVELLGKNSFAGQDFLARMDADRVKRMGTSKRKREEKKPVTRRPVKGSSEGVGRILNERTPTWVVSAPQLTSREECVGQKREEKPLTIEPGRSSENGRIVSAGAKRSAKVPPKPEGYDKDIERLRAAYRNRLEQREKEENMVLKVPICERVRPTQPSVREMVKSIPEEDVRIVDVAGRRTNPRQREFSRQRKGDGSYSICYHTSPRRTLIAESLVLPSGLHDTPDRIALIQDKERRLHAGQSLNSQDRVEQE
jgi:hypothetical protein